MWLKVWPKVLESLMTPGCNSQMQSLRTLSQAARYVENWKTSRGTFAATWPLSQCVYRQVVCSTSKSLVSKKVHVHVLLGSLRHGSHSSHATCVFFHVRFVDRAINLDCLGLVADITQECCMLCFLKILPSPSSDSQSLRHSCEPDSCPHAKSNELLLQRCTGQDLHPLPLFTFSRQRQLLSQFPHLLLQTPHVVDTETSSFKSRDNLKAPIAAFCKQTT